MGCKILFFEYKNENELFFKKNPLENFCIKLINYALDESSIDNLEQDDYESTVALNISSNSNITKDIIDRFKNLRVISTRTQDCSHIDLNSCIKRNIAVVNVDTYKPDCDYHNLNMSFKSITAFLCGSKEQRVV